MLKNGRLQLCRRDALAGNCALNTMQAKAKAVLMINKREKRLHKSSQCLLTWLHRLDQQTIVTRLEHTPDHARFGLIKRFLRKQDMFTVLESHS